MTKSLQRVISAVLLLILLTGLLSAGASADADMRRVVVGADLTDEQIESVYQVFGIRRGDVPEIRLTNLDEHAVLDGYVDAAIIGTRAMSCVYLELLSQGSGMNVKVQNISWCTPDMYTSAFATAGITDARIVVAAPFPVSGTAALAGIYKAYEDMTGQTLDAAAKDVSTQELTVTGELANEIGSADSTSIVNDLKQMLNETANMTDDELRATIRRVASTYRVELTDAQVQQLLDLCRSLEKLDPDALTKRVGDIQSTLEKVEEAKEQVVGFFETVKRIVDGIRDFIDRVSSLFGRR